MKLCSPNKVFLLRGMNELNSQMLSTGLHKECIRKYGSTNGPIIYETFHQIFAKLPIALVVDDSILCTHSGIPYSITRLGKLAKLPKEIKSAQRDYPFVYEIITRYPKILTNFIHKSPDVMIEQGCGGGIIKSERRKGFKSNGKWNNNGNNNQSLKSKLNSNNNAATAMPIDNNANNSIQSKSVIFCLNK